mmetsp:Transcript_47654/g.152717  ORF Transcript_47654/g.152717 Transcript_47654/m.152717 type:complete len:219 (+) Transcript_47654:397-1053(+)
MGQRAMRTLRVSSFWALSWAIPVASSASILALVAASVAAVSASVLDLASEMAFWASARAAPMMDSALAEISAISPALPFTLESWLRIIPSRSSRVLPTGVNQNLSRNTMRSTNWAAMMGAVRLKSKILPASAEAGMAMSTLASAMVAPLRAAAGTSILLMAALAAATGPIVAEHAMASFTARVATGAAFRDLPWKAERVATVATGATALMEVVAAMVR